MTKAERAARPRVVIRKNDIGEYEVPTGGNSGYAICENIYFTEDRQDAIDTARTCCPTAVLSIRSGTYFPGDR